MRCPDCPVAPDRHCLCEDAPNGLCSRPEYRDLAARCAANPERCLPMTEERKRELLPLVSACPHRGHVLGVSQQRECGCAELTECRAGEGPAHRPGAVTLAECLACVGP